MSMKFFEIRTRATLASAVVSIMMGVFMSAQALAEPATVETPELTLKQAQGSGSVGTVGLVLGKAYLLSQGQPQQLIRVGTRVHVSDQILTEANGHVHIRFDDDALVSVRPHSSLEIVNYDYDSDQPQNSSIKLNLEEGVTRAISGKGARAARERFRLNTPIAAIGVRGTDFVVSASRNGVRALVNEGAIVLAPYSIDCTAEAFGPCATNSVELTDNTMQIIQLDGGTGTPQLLPAPHEREPDAIRSEVQLATADASHAAEDKTTGTGVYLENVTSHKVTAEASTTAAAVPKPPVIIDFTPSGQLSVAAASQRQLIWGRHGSGQGAQERMTLAYADAKSGRSVTVGNGEIGNPEYQLFRDESSNQRIPSELGPVSFALNSAQAFYHSDTGIVAMAVHGGSLDINFSNNSFATALNMSHSATGNVDFTASGKLNSGGYFHSTSATERMVGAVSLDGKEAGYFFEKQLQNGGIQGLTLWDKR